MDQSTVRTTAERSDTVLARDPRTYNSDKPLHEIEDDIARTRVRLGATIEALERELAPARVVQVLRNSLEPPAGILSRTIPGLCDPAGADRSRARLASCFAAEQMAGPDALRVRRDAGRGGRTE